MASLRSHVARTLCAACLVACAGLADLDQPYQLARGGEGGAAPACPPAVLPVIEPPRPGAAPPGVDTEFFVALDAIDFGEDTDGNAPCGERPLPGLNLDQLESTPESGACQPAPNPEMRNQFLCDGIGGVDNQNANLSGAFGTASQLGSVEATDAAKRGEWSVVVRVSNYNGALEDDAVTVALYPSLETGDAPRWDGTDELPIDETSVNGGLDAPVYVTSTAFVTCGMLVATIGDFRLDMMNPPAHLRISLESFRLIARLLRDDAQRIALDGVVAGVWPLAQSFADLESDRVFDGSAICADGNLTYELIHDLVCLLPDTTQGTASITTPCDAFSLGATFHASPVARPTVIAAPPAYPVMCAPDVRPINDTCD